MLFFFLLRNSGKIIFDFCTVVVLVNPKHLCVLVLWPTPCPQIPRALCGHVLTVGRHSTSPGTLTIAFLRVAWLSRGPSPHELFPTPSWNVIWLGLGQVATAMWVGSCVQWPRHVQITLFLYNLTALSSVMSPEPWRGGVWYKGPI